MIISITLSLAVLNAGAQDKPDLGKLAVQLKDKDPGMRLSAIDELGQMESPQAVDLLIGMLVDTDQGVRAAAALALGQMNSAKASDALIKLLKSEHPRDRRSAAVALGMIGGDKAREALTVALESALNEDRESAVAALGNMGDPKAMMPSFCECSKTFTLSFVQAQPWRWAGLETSAPSIRSPACSPIRTRPSAPAPLSPLENSAKNARSSRSKGF